MIIKLTTSLYNEYGEDEGGVSKEFNSIHDAVKAMESFTVSGGAGCQASSNYSVLTDSGECLFSGPWEELKALSNTKGDCIGVIEILPDNTADHRGFWFDGENAFRRAFSTLLDCRDLEPGSVFRIMHHSDFVKLQKPVELWVITYDDIDNEYTSTGIEGVFTGTQDEVIALCHKLNEKHDNLIFSYHIAERLN